MAHWRLCTLQKLRQATCPLSGPSARGLFSAPAAFTPPQLPSCRWQSIRSRRPEARARAVVVQDEDKEVLAAPAAAVAVPASNAAASFTTRDLDQEIYSLAIPGAAAMAADTLASLVSTAWVGRLGSMELASVGVALSLYVAATKLVNTPMLIVSVSTIAAALGEEEKKTQAGGEASEAMAGIGRALSGTILVSLLVGLVEGLALGLGAVPGLQLWGAGPDSPLHTEAANYLLIRALTAPIPLLLITLQGCCRGLGDSKSQIQATVICNVINIVLEPVFIFGLGWGVKGAASAVALSQLVSVAVLLVTLGRQYPLRLAGGQALKKTVEYLKPTGLVMLRTLAVYSCFATATGIVARTDAVHTAGHQVCLQVALAGALLADSLSVAAQALMARSTAAYDQDKAKAVADRSLQLSIYLGAAVMAGLGAAAPFFPHLFTEDAAVLGVISHTMPFVVAIQLFYSLGFLMDGLVYGVGGYRYASIAAGLSAAFSLAVMLGGTSLVERWGGGDDEIMTAVWLGLNTLLAFRFLTVYVPFRLRWGPFEGLAR